jgi:hypothetical protein
VSVPTLCDGPKGQFWMSFENTRAAKTRMEHRMEQAIEVNSGYAQLLPYESAERPENIIASSVLSGNRDDNCGVLRLNIVLCAYQSYRIQCYHNQRHVAENSTQAPVCAEDDISLLYCAPFYDGIMNTINNRTPCTPSRVFIRSL